MYYDILKEIKIRFGSNGKLIWQEYEGIGHRCLLVFFNLIYSHTLNWMCCK